MASLPWVGLFDVTSLVGDVLTVAHMFDLHSIQASLDQGGLLLLIL